ncbi:hypothetical protein FBU30_009452 [Linnemannia zychae]|nr:hypothetical protein FBU30_009452 [Linnemannia zychae]
MLSYEQGTDCRLSATFSGCTDTFYITLTIVFAILIGVTPISCELDFPTIVTVVSSYLTVGRASRFALEIPNKLKAAYKISAGRGVSGQRIGCLNQYQKAQKREKLDVQHSINN